MAHLSHDDKMLYSNLFLKVDGEYGNGDGALNPEEFGKLMEVCGHRMSKQQIAQSFVAIDKDGNWKITLDEFLAILPRAVPPDSRQFIAARIRRIFESYDLNKDGFINLDEMKKVLEQADQTLTEEIEKTFKECDKDKDGRLNFEEFLTIFVEED